MRHRLPGAVARDGRRAEEVLTKNSAKAGSHKEVYSHFVGTGVLDGPSQ
jgi:hypothetical protein